MLSLCAMCCMHTMCSKRWGEMMRHTCSSCVSQIAHRQRRLQRALQPCIRLRALHAKKLITCALAATCWVQGGSLKAHLRAFKAHERLAAQRLPAALGCLLRSRRCCCAGATAHSALARMQGCVGFCRPWTRCIRWCIRCSCSCVSSSGCSGQPGFRLTLQPCRVRRHCTADRARRFCAFVASASCGACQAPCTHGLVIGPRQQGWRVRMPCHGAHTSGMATDQQALLQRRTAHIEDLHAAQAPGTCKHLSLGLC